MRADDRWPRGPGAALARRIARLLSWGVPRSVRADVLAEWEGELSTLLRDVTRGRRPRILSSARFCAGLIPHLIWIRREVRSRARDETAAARTGILPFVHLRRDAAYAIRSLARRPGFAATAIAIAGLGIGATTLIYSVVDRVLLRSLPYDHPESLVWFEHASHSPPEFVDWRDRTTAFAQIAAANTNDYDLTGVGEPQRVRVARVTRDFFPLFGATPALGRLLAPEDYTSGTRVAVLDFGTWQRWWGGDPGIVGQRITLNGNPVEVVGVLAPTFEPPEVMVGRGVEIWVPIDVMSESLQYRGLYILNVVARLRPDVPFGAAQAQLNTQAAAWADELPDRYRNADGTPSGVSIVPLRDATVQDVTKGLVLLSGAVGLMLLIACANVANLLLAHGTTRAREVALRTALGAERTRIVGQFLTESVVLAVGGGVLGVALARGGLAGFRIITTGDLPRTGDLSLDARVLSFALALSIVTGVVFGVLPAFRAARTDLTDTLKESAGSVTEGRRGRRLRDVLVAVEMALALVLLAGAGTLYGSFLRVQRIDPGIATEGVYAVPLALNGLRSTERRQFVDRVLAEVRALPGVTAAAAGTGAPFVFTGGSRCCWGNEFYRDADSPREGGVLHPVTEDYFRTLGATLIRGRAFTAADRFEDPVPVVLTEAASHRLFGDEDPVGKPLNMVGNTLTVVGLVADIRHWGLTEDAIVDVYVPHASIGENSYRLQLLVASPRSVAALREPIRSAIWSVNPDIPVPGVIPMRERIAESLTSQRFYVAIVGVFAVLAMAMAAAGMYSSMLYSVQGRRRELGIRVALGARRGQVVRLVLTHGLLLVGVGAVAGLIGASFLGSLLEAVSYDVHATDVTVLTLVTGILTGVAMIACYVPARRAAGADPIETLRAE